MKRLMALLLFWGSLAAQASIPQDYEPVVVEAPFSLKQRVFDLTAAKEISRQTGKPLFIYLGAADCPPCLEYKRFLSGNRNQLKDAFAKVVVVDIRTWLRGPTITLKVDDQRLTVAQFKTLVGDTSTQWVYPSFWLLSPDFKPLKQLPQGTKDYLGIDQHLEILKIPPY